MQSGRGRMTLSSSSTGCDGRLQKWMSVQLIHGGRVGRPACLLGSTRRTFLAWMVVTWLWSLLPAGPSNVQLVLGTVSNATRGFVVAWVRN